MLTDCMWQKILKANLLYVNHDMGDIWFGCPTLLYAVASKISNLFWQEIIKTFAILLEDIHYSHPYFFYNFNVFDNKLFSRNNIELKCADFISLWNKQICRGGNFFDCSQSQELSLEQIDTKYNIRLNFLNYHRLTNMIKKAAKELIKKKIVTLECMILWILDY